VDAPNLLSTLPPAILNYPGYVASQFDPNSTAAKNILAAGYPPDLTIIERGTPTSLWGLYYLGFWEVTMCQWQKRLDPAYDTYGAGLGNYIYVNRISVSDVAENLADFRTTGRIRRPLITVAGTMDALLPIDDNARTYARRVTAAARDGIDKNPPAYRLYEVQNGNHIETFKQTFPQLELIQPHAQKAFDLLVSAVEHSAELPPNQCIPRGGMITKTPHSRVIVSSCWPREAEMRNSIRPDSRYQDERDLNCDQFFWARMSLYRNRRRRLLGRRLFGQPHDHAAGADEDRDLTDL